LWKGDVADEANQTRQRIFEKTVGACGAVPLATAAISSSFVGAAAASFIVAELLRIYHGGKQCWDGEISMRSPSSNEFKIEAKPYDPVEIARYGIRAEDVLGEGSLKQKCRDNFAAIELVRSLDAENRPATDDEKRTLVKYVGWGGMPQVFAWHESNDWQMERERIKTLLTGQEYEAARASTLNAHYTAPIVVSAMYEAVQRLGLAAKYSLI
jgi:hypothetical protein